MVGFEPTTPWPQTKASKPLKYIPFILLAGIEPALFEKTDFKSAASTNSATGAREQRYSR